MGGSIVIIAEQHGGQMAPVSYELMGLAEEIQALYPMEVRTVILGQGPETLAREWADSMGGGVVAVDNPHLKTYNSELYKDILGRILPELKPVFIVMPCTTQGMDLAPGLSVRLRAACLTAVDGVRLEQGEICFTRKMYNGKIEAVVRPTVKTTLLSVQPGSFKTQKPARRDSGLWERRSIGGQPEKTRALGRKQIREEDAGLARADVVVAAGRGIGKEGNLSLIRRLAALFPKSAVAGSRPLCDSGWLEYKQQVGLTGATVSPKLYIACGISGAIQHTVGMQGAGFVVALSTDPNAAIFNLADVCIIEDLTTFIPVLLETYAKETGRSAG